MHTWNIVRMGSVADGDKAKAKAEAKKKVEAAISKPIDELLGLIMGGYSYDGAYLISSKPTVVKHGEAPTWEVPGYEIGFETDGIMTGAEFKALTAEQRDPFEENGFAIEIEDIEDDELIALIDNHS